MSGKSDADHGLVGWSCFSTEEPRVTLPRKPVSVYWAFFWNEQDLIRLDFDDMETLLIEHIVFWTLYGSLLV